MTSFELFVEGWSFDRWTRVQIDSDLLTPADAFQFEIARSEVSAAAWRQVLRAVRPGQRCQVRVAGALQMTGRIDEMTVEEGQEGTVCHLNGRDLAAPLADWQPLPNLSWTNTALVDLVGQIVAPFGINAVRASNVANRDVLTGRVRGVRPEPLPEGFRSLQVDKARSDESTAWELIDQHARRFGLIPWMSVDGALVLGTPDYLQAPRYRLRRRFDGDGNNVLPGAQYRVSVAELPTTVTVMLRSGGGHHGHRTRQRVPESARVYYPDGTPALPLDVLHPKVIRDSAVRSRPEAERRARRELAHAAQNWRTYSCRVAGVLHGTALWAVDTTVHVDDDVAGLDEVWYVHGRTFSTSREGTFTELRLSPLKAIVP